MQKIVKFFQSSKSIYLFSFIFILSMTLKILIFSGTGTDELQNYPWFIEDEFSKLLPLDVLLIVFIWVSSIIVAVQILRVVLNSLKKLF